MVPCCLGQPSKFNYGSAKVIAVTSAQRMTRPSSRDTALASTDKTYLDFPDALHYFEPGEGEADNAGTLAQMAQLVPWLQARVPL